MNSTNVKAIRKPEAANISGLGITSMYNLGQAGLFPTLIKLGARASAYLEHEVQAVTVARAAGYNDDQIRELVSKLIEQRQTVVNSLINSLAA